MLPSQSLVLVTKCVELFLSRLKWILSLQHAKGRKSLVAFYKWRTEAQGKLTVAELGTDARSLES